MKNRTAIKVFLFILIYLGCYNPFILSGNAEVLDEMAAYWRLDEDVPGLYEDTVSGNDGRCKNICPDPTLDGLTGGGQIFNGVNTGIEVTDTEAFDWKANESFSIEFWFKRTGALSVNEVIVGRLDTRNSLQWWAGLWRNGKAGFVLIDKQGTGNHNACSSQVLADGNWHHVVVMRDCTALPHQSLLYVDGKLDVWEMKAIIPDLIPPRQI